MPPSASRGFGKWNADTQDEEVNAIDSAPNDSDEDEDNLNIKDSRRSRKHTAPSQAFNPAARLRLQYTLVICYLSCLTLRIPILMKDILEWVQLSSSTNLIPLTGVPICSLAESYKLDYLEALQAIPSDMRKHLNLALTDLELVQNVRFRTSVTWGSILISLLTACSTHHWRRFNFNTSQLCSFGERFRSDVAYELLGDISRYKSCSNFIQDSAGFRSSSWVILFSSSSTNTKLPHS